MIAGNEVMGLEFRIWNLEVGILKVLYLQSAPPDKGAGGFENRTSCNNKRNQEDTLTF